MNGELAEELERLLSEPAKQLSRIAGGDVNEAFVATLASGRKVFVKTRAAAPRGMYACEAEGLAWLAAADCLRVPETLAVSDRALVLSYLERGERRADFEERLGRGLAHLHRHGAPSFGLERDNYIGPLVQPNGALPSFAEFYRERRLAPFVRLAYERQRLDRGVVRDFERLYPRLPELMGPAEPPARLHGDLWSGNVYVDSRGEPVLIDPAVYGGHRELDLAMLRLFGSPSPRLFAAYHEIYPLAPQHEERSALFQLYPLLVHVHLFGSAYVGSLREALARYL